MSVRVTHRVVADKLGVNVSTVSRLRTGIQFPTWGTMQKVAAAYGWKVDQQAMAREQGTWQEDFEALLRAHYDRKKEHHG